MLRNEYILKSFLEHELISDKYELKDSDLPQNFREAKNSPIPIVKAIALIIENLESTPPATDNTLRNLITQYLNEAAI